MTGPNALRVTVTVVGPGQTAGATAEAFQGVNDTDLDVVFEATQRAAQAALVAYGFDGTDVSGMFEEPAGDDEMPTGN